MSALLVPIPIPLSPDGLNLGFGINSAGRSWQGIRTCARILHLGAALGNWDGAQLPAGTGCESWEMPTCPGHRSLGTSVLGTSELPKPLPSLNSRLLGETVALAKAIEAFACWFKKKKNNKEKQNQSDINVQPGFRSEYIINLFNCVSGLFLPTRCRSSPEQRSERWECTWGLSIT